jgi:multiple antibiotic resistance protein
MFEIIIENAISLATAILVLFIVVDPLGNIPIFMSLTENMPKDKKRKTFNTATITGIILLLIFVFVGQEIFDESHESIGAVPIAMPLLVGPGAITTVIFNLQLYGILITSLAIIITLVITWIILRFANKVYHFLGQSGSLVIARVNALFIAAIAIQYILVGITEFIKS